MSTKDLQDNLAKEAAALPVCRVALLGDYPTQFLARAIKSRGVEEKLDLEVFDADFNQIDRQIIDSGSELYESKPEFVIIYPSAEKLWERFAATASEAKSRFAAGVLAEIERWWKTVAQLSKAKVIHFNFVELADGTFGHFAAKTASSFAYQVKTINLGLMDLAREQKHVFVANLAGLVTQAGYAAAHDPRLNFTAKITLSIDFFAGGGQGSG